MYIISLPTNQQPSCSCLRSEFNFRGCVVVVDGTVTYGFNRGPANKATKPIE